MRIGVIVTTYNNSDSILRCLNSVKYFKNKLTKYDIRIILVDDASVDNTPKLLLEFTKTIPSTIFKKYNKNGGVSRSRNYGISKSLDMDYLLFVDGDDELDSKLSNYLSAIKLVNDFYTFVFVLRRVGGLHISIANQQSVFENNRCTHKRKQRYRMRPQTKPMCRQ